MLHPTCTVVNGYTTIVVAVKDLFRYSPEQIAAVHVLESLVHSRFINVTPSVLYVSQVIYPKPPEHVLYQLATSLRDAVEYALGLRKKEL